MNALIIASNASSFDEYSYYRDWQEGFLNHPDLQVDFIDLANIKTGIRVPLLRKNYDLIVFLHSTHPALDNTRKLSILRWMLKGIRGTRIFFLNNEFRDWQAKLDMAEYLGARFLISQLNTDDARMVYDTWAHEILCMPYGLNPTAYQPVTVPEDRLIDVGFRGDYYSAYVGHIDRNLLLDRFKDEVLNRYPNTRVDICVGQRFERDDWAKFLNNCLALVGHEAGMSRVDKDENIRLFVNAQEKRLPAEQFEKLISTMRETGVFDAPPSGRIAAPRNFDAMGTKTLQILLPGRYNNVLLPGVHYVELQPDFSNLDRVMETLFDENERSKIVDFAYQDALANHTYEQRINTLIRVVS